MIVVCEGCERRFQLDDRRIPETGARVRCKYCQHRFRVPPPGDASNEAPDLPASARSLGESADSETQISPEDTLFGMSAGEGVGAPIDGDRSLFGTIDVEAPETIDEAGEPVVPPESVTPQEGSDEEAGPDA